MACNCIEVVDKELAEHHTRLLRAFTFGRDGQPSDRLMIATEKLRTAPRGKKAVAMFPTFCPFCGVAYHPEEITDAGVAA